MDTKSRPVRVECYSGYQYAQEPRAVERPEGRAEVASVLRRWREPRGPAFRVRLADGNEATLRYDEALDQWFMESD
ncbi:MAG: hypothetical protein QHH80_04350 [Anaerolineae bacterium]|jgi:hypothetical protein|nr:hypothetical protein [Anaerolineae bacterium]